MKVKTEPLLGAAMFAIVVLVVGNLFYLILTYQGLQAMMNSPLFDPGTMQSLEQGTLTPAEEAALNRSFEETLPPPGDFPALAVCSLACPGWWQASEPVCCIPSCINGASLRLSALSVVGLFLQHWGM